ncbi:GNAT family N-acetyltransferase [Paramicrobacterium fandaimingii]|uniref:GNAT family N-acetyltransferase n=1 Tax=Paramicrobacterium fandaimingii TaxID=2708079 RepID=UPI001422BA98|nr:GNAT family N-acetyltransferase [Microbacterium fandaimingii]
MVSGDIHGRARLLAAYDAKLRTDAETSNAISVECLGLLRLAVFAGGRGFITYQNLNGVKASGIRELVRDALNYYLLRTEIDSVEWKTRAHDVAPGLHESLIGSGFVADESESIMIGDASGLAVDVALPPEVSLRRITDEHNVRAMCAMQHEVFGDPVSVHMADAVLARLASADGLELWIAEADGEIVSAGRLEPVSGTEFAGIWGGATREEWRGRGIYRALTAARARSALSMGKTLLHSDSTEYSRPILERAGLVAVSTTTPYVWNR